MKKAADVAADRGVFVEEIAVTPVPEFPPRIVLQCLCTNGAEVEVVFANAGAHKVSDELLKAVAANLRARGVQAEPT